METTAARRPPANDEGVCGMFINLFRRQRPALARLARKPQLGRQHKRHPGGSQPVGQDDFSEGIEALLVKLGFQHALKACS